MEAKINIAEILRDKPVNTKLYSPLFGDVYFSHVKDSIINVKHHAGESKFLNSGRYYNYVESEPLLFPSKEMSDWSKFAWKKGDVLVSDDGCIEVIFDKWYDDTYTNFYCKHYLDSEDENDIRYLEEFICSTWKYSLEDTESFLCYVTNIEERLGGKLNLETLEIEKQLEFKDGDILSIQEDEEHYHAILIFKGGTDVYVYFDYFHRVLTYGTKIDENEKSISHLATDEEKQQLFSALKKENKAWDADKKMFVDLKPKVELKPFDKVLVKDNLYGSWEPALFWKKVDVKDLHPYMIIGGKKYRYCEPYEGNEHLLDTN